MDITRNNRQHQSCLHSLQQGIPVGRMPHPAAQITIWVCLTVLAQGLHGLALVALGAVMLAFSMGICAARLFALLRRTRWIFISLLLIYSYATPAAPCWVQLGAFSPSCEGMLDGLTQLTRLLTVLAGLAILLSLLSTAQLIGGLYILAYPLRYLGVSRERIAVRLALTLGYAESAMRDTAQDWRASISNLNHPVPPHTGSIELQQLPLRLRDWLAVILAGAVLLGAGW